MTGHQFGSGLTGGGTAVVGVLVDGLHGSSTHRLSVDVFVRHRDGGRGVCALCGCRMPCPVRRRAAAVIVAAGEDPGSYANRPAGLRDGGDRRGVEPGRARVAVPADVVGYRVGGVGRRADVPFFDFER